MSLTLSVLGIPATVCLVTQYVPSSAVGYSSNSFYRSTRPAEWKVVPSQILCIVQKRQHCSFKSKIPHLKSFLAARLKSREKV